MGAHYNSQTSSGLRSGVRSALENRIHQWKPRARRRPVQGRVRGEEAVERRCESVAPRALGRDGCAHQGSSYRYARSRRAMGKQLAGGIGVGGLGSQSDRGPRGNPNVCVLSYRGKSGRPGASQAFYLETLLSGSGLKFTEPPTLPAAVSISSCSGPICCDSCQQQLLGRGPLPAPCQPSASQKPRRPGRAQRFPLRPRFLKVTARVLKKLLNAL